LKSTADIVLDINGTTLAPGVTGGTELSTIIPFLILPADADFEYAISAIKAADGPQDTEAVVCIIDSGLASAGVPGGKVVYSAAPSTAGGWDGRVNRTPYVSGETGAPTIPAGGYCTTAGAASATCTSC
jgi:hypothetical protein